MRRFSSRFTASVTAAALGLGLLVVSPGQARATTLEDKTTFLGIEGTGDEVAALSDAIRWDLNQRGMDDGSTMTLAELKLTLGCGDDDLKCFAQGGETLGTTQLVYGSVVKQGKDFVILLQALDVATGELSSRVNRTVPASALGESELGKTAASLVDELYGLTAAPDETDFPDPDEPGYEDPAESDPDDEVVTATTEGQLIWGPYKPRPAWKYAGLGISAGLMLGSLGVGVATAVMTSENGSVSKEIMTAAEQSLTDSKASNDVDPNGADLCAAARTPPDSNKPDEVTNASVTQACIKYDNTKTIGTVGWIGTGVFAVSTALFTTLLFVHRDKSEAAAALHRHKVGLGGAPTPDGGFMLGGSLRF